MMRKYKILVADDDADDFEFINSILHEINPLTQTEHVLNGKELIDHLNEKLISQQPFPDLILLDINMPKVNGFQALKMIKSKKDTCSIPTLMYSTSACPVQMEQCYVLGANGFFTKSHCEKITREFAQEIFNCLEGHYGFHPVNFSFSLKAAIQKNN
ncbi:MAG: Response regulator rcp1 [Bacteroidetes bacterium]|nr:Response regulator rcp1 [Bacteroidota bacterium]